MFEPDSLQEQTNSVLIEEHDGVIDVFTFADQELLVYCGWLHFTQDMIVFRV